MINDAIRAEVAQWLGLAEWTGSDADVLLLQNRVAETTGLITYLLLETEEWAAYINDAIYLDSNLVDLLFRVWLGEIRRTL